MGVFCDLVQVTEYELSEILSHPPEVARAFDRESRRRVPPGREEGQLMLFGLPSPPRPRRASTAKISLGKEWASLLFLLTGELRGGASPLSNAINGTGRIGGGFDEGGEVRYLTSPQVSEASAALSGVTHEGLRRQFDPHDPVAPWRVDDRDPAEFIFQELVSCFDLLAAYYRDAATNDMAMLIGFNWRDIAVEDEI